MLPTDVTLYFCNLIFFFVIIASGAVPCGHSKHNLTSALVQFFPFQTFVTKEFTKVCVEKKSGDKNALL